MPAQLNAFLAQHPPNRGVRDAERGGQGTAIPPGQPGWRRQLQLPQNAQPHLGTVFWFLAWPRLIAQPGYTLGRKPLAPQTDRVWPYSKLARHLVVPLTIQTSQNDLGTLDQASLFATAGARFISSTRCSAEHSTATATRVTRHLSWYGSLRHHTKYHI